MSEYDYGESQDVSTRQSMINAIEQAEEEERVKLVGLFRHHQRLQPVDDDYDIRLNQNSIRRFQRNLGLTERVARGLRHGFVLADLSPKLQREFFSDGELKQLKEREAEDACQQPPASQDPCPGDWLALLLKVPSVCQYIYDRDKPVLRYLRGLSIAENADELVGFVLTFHFFPNEFMEGTQAVVAVMEEPNKKDELEISEVNSGGVEWQRGKDPRYARRTFVDANGETKARDFECNSFFWIFGHFAQEDMNSQDDFPLNPFSKTTLFASTKPLLSALRYDFLDSIIPAHFGLSVHKPPSK